MTPARIVLLVAAFVVASSCAEAGPVPPGGGGGGVQRYEADATVLDAGSGPELCLGAVADSLPPQCGGPPILGWSWSEVDGEESVSGVTWGTFHVTGTFDGTSFTVEEVGPPPPPAGPDGDPFRTPCPEPSGGWVDVDASKTGEADRLATMRVAERSEEFAGLWIDSLGPVDELDPPPFVLNVAFTGDPATYEDDLRAVWGGPLCVLRFDHGYRDLRRIQRELGDGGAEALGLELLWSSVDVMTNRVEIGTIVIDDDGRAALDAAYGRGVVRVVPALRPVGEPSPTAS
ncbi:MAG TPA: hypothetical protein VF108_06830 [Actinomycetota bacterium]